MGSKSQKKKIVRARKVFVTLVAVLLVLPIIFEGVAAVWDFSSPAKALLDVFSADVSDSITEFVEFLRVGQGDCTVIKSGDMVAVIDFGLADENDSIYKRLLSIGITKIDLAVITHHHSDHMGGFSELAENIPISRLLINNFTAQDGDKKGYNQVVSVAKEQNIKLYLPKSRSKFTIGNAVLEVLYVNPDAAKENNRSIVIMLYMGGKKILFTGDGENAVERYITDNFDVDCDILKMGHHGSYTSTSARFLKEATPQIAVASCGYDNEYGHPSGWSLLRLDEMKVTLYRTDLDRNIRCTFNTENSTFSVTTQRGGLK